MLKYTSIKPERLVGVLHPDQPKGAVPRWFVSRQQAQALLDENSATWSGRWTLKLFEAKPLQVRGESCHIKEHTILAAISGSERARAVINSWAWA